MRNLIKWGTFLFVKMTFMQVVADLHLHSKYSRAVSQQMTLPVMADVASQKGIDLLTASDFTHPLWQKEISTQLVEIENGMYCLKGSTKGPYFILSTEISSIYSENGKLRRIHNLVFAPSLETVAKITSEMKKRGYNLHSDGRPIIGLPSRKLLEMIMEIDDDAFLIPCHVWTPHFGLYGSASGYESIEEAFGDLSKYVYGIETGLSSDPEMNWQIPELENRTILSFSDAHSPAKMGREATVFFAKNEKQFIPTFNDLRLAIMRSEESRLKIGYTIEFYPEEGKYHYSGHRNCNFSRSPKEIEEAGESCPVCSKRLTEGVFVRLKNLAGGKEFIEPVIREGGNGVRWFSDSRKKQPPFLKLVPLLEICAESLSSTVASKKSKALYDLLLKVYGSEFEVLLKVPISEIALSIGEKVAEGIGRVRRGEIYIRPGFDGEYGAVKIWQEKEMAGASTSPQLSLEL